jgi:hypothetical protein
LQLRDALKSCGSRRQFAGRRDINAAVTTSTCPISSSVGADVADQVVIRVRSGKCGKNFIQTAFPFCAGIAVWASNPRFSVARIIRKRAGYLTEQHRRGSVPITGSGATPTGGVFQIIQLIA